jgi:hypothetical protein
MPFGMMGRALGGGMKAPAQAALGKQKQQPQMKQPMKPQGGIGPSMGSSMGARMAAARPQPQQNMMQGAVQNVGQMMGQAFNRPSPQQGLQNMAQGGANLAQNLMRPQPPPEPMPENPMQQDQNIQALENMKMQQLAAGIGGRFGGGYPGMARPHMQPPQMAEGPMPMPDEGMDEQRVNKFQQLRRGGIGPRGGPQQY